jgi:hypothetical protein
MVLWYNCTSGIKHTGSFIIFNVVTNNKKTKGPTLIKLFTATGKLKTFFCQLGMFDVCTTGALMHGSLEQ